QKGGGAFLNGKKITVSTQKTIEGGFFVSCLPYGRGESFKRSMDVFTVISQQAFGMRNVGAAALDGAYTAAGIFDGVFFQDLGWWDIAACSLLIQEAGGMVTDYSGKPIDKDYQSFLGGNREVYTELQPFLKEIVS
ncbi:MAG: inositol monophosphatase family protein, partial [Candidatus Babeliales bacterium]